MKPSRRHKADLGAAPLCSIGATLRRQRPSFSAAYGQHVRKRGNNAHYEKLDTRHDSANQSHKHGQHEGQVTGELHRKIAKRETNNKGQAHKAHMHKIIGRFHEKILTLKLFGGF